MKIYTILFFKVTLLIFISANCLAQNDFRAGYIITNSNDTVYGLIAYKGSNTSSKTCTFIKNGSNDKINHSPLDIKGYRFIDNKYYVSKIVKTGINEITVEPVFLEFLINGIVDIYFFRNDDGDHYFIDQGDGSLIELRNDMRELYIDNIKYFQESKQYIGVLKHIFENSPKITKEADNMTFDHKSLIRIAKDYNNAVCNEKCIIYEKKMPKLHFKFGASVSLDYYTLKLPDNTKLYQPYSVSSLKSRISPSLGLFMRMNLPSIDENLFLEYDISLNKRNFSSELCNLLTDYVYNGYDSLIIYSAVKCKLSSIRNSLIIRYEFPITKIVPLIFGGIYCDGIYNASYSRIDTLYEHKASLLNGTSIKTSHNLSNTFPLSSYDWGVVLGAGSVYKIGAKHEIGLDIIYSAGTYKELTTKTKNLSIKLRYIF